MSAAAETFAAPGAGRGALVRWPACLALVLALHAAAVLALLRSADPWEPPAASTGAIVADLAPMQEEPAATEEAPPARPEPEPEPVAEAPPDPPPPEPVGQAAEAPPDPPPEPVEQIAETPPDPPPEPAAAVPDAVLPQPPPPPPPPPVQQRPVVRPQAQQRSVAEERRPAQADARQTVAAAAPPAPAAAQPPSPSGAVPTWQGQLLGRLQRFKRYPDSARSRREEGVVHLTFAMDREGRVLAAGIAKGSGFPELDAETLALVRRAEPLPPPPPEMPGGTLTLTVPVRFSLR